MKIAYYPGCTLKTRAKNLEDAALAALRVLGIAAVELPRWNCCGAVYSLTDDDLIHQVAPVRDLIRVKEQGAETVMTLCSMCYNTLARANRLMREDEEKRHTLNTFMDEEPDYHGEVEVHHLLTLLRDRIGWKTLAAKVRRPLTGLKVAPYYGCTLVRPRPVSIDPRPDQPTILDDFLRALGAEPVDYPARIECCGAYNILSEPDAAHRASANVLASAERHGAELVITSCPLCEYNLGTCQNQVLPHGEGLRPLPTLYFSQLLALALGVGNEELGLELSPASSLKLVAERISPIHQA